MATPLTEITIILSCGQRQLFYPVDQIVQPFGAGRGAYMFVRGIRGATSVEVDSREAILEATRELLEEILRVNGIDRFDDLVSAIFTTSPDLKACFPAEAARSLGMSEVPLLCASEIAVPGALTRCIRVLLHVNTDKKQNQISHIYLREAVKLRPDMKSAQ